MQPTLAILEYSDEVMYTLSLRKTALLACKSETFRLSSILLYFNIFSFYFFSLIALSWNTWRDTLFSYGRVSHTYYFTFHEIQE